MHSQFKIIVEEFMIVS